MLWMVVWWCATDEQCPTGSVPRAGGTNIQEIGGLDGGDGVGGNFTGFLGRIAKTFLWKLKFTAGVASCKRDSC